MFAEHNIIDFILALIRRALIFGMNLDVIKDKMNSMKNYHGRSSPGKQKEHVAYIGVPMIQGLSLRNRSEIREELQLTCQGEEQ